MALQPTSMPPIIILGGGAAKIDNIKVWNNDLEPVCMEMGDPRWVK